MYTYPPSYFALVQEAAKAYDFFTDDELEAYFDEQRKLAEVKEG